MQKHKELCQHAWTSHANISLVSTLLWHNFFSLPCSLVQRLDTPLIRELQSAMGRIPVLIRLRNILFRDIPKCRFLKERKDLDIKTRKRANTCDIFLAASLGVFLTNSLTKFSYSIQKSRFYQTSTFFSVSMKKLYLHCHLVRGIKFIQFV